jgi:predicted nucleic acid-binding protein
MTGTRYLLDSDVVADALKGQSQAVQLLSTLALDGLTIILVTYGEIYEGILYSRDSRDSERVFNRFLRDVTVVPMTRLIVRRFAQLRGQLRAAGNIISDFDLLIAATAIQYNPTFVTRNKRHFARVPGLTLY